MSKLFDPHLQSELVQNEDRFNTVRDALKGMQKLDLDKLICSVGECQYSCTIFAERRN